MRQPLPGPLAGLWRPALEAAKVAAVLPETYQVRLPLGPLVAVVLVAGAVTVTPGPMSSVALEPVVVGMPDQAVALVRRLVVQAV